jgi:hypothetical protein
VTYIDSVLKFYRHNSNLSLHKLRISPISASAYTYESSACSASDT